MVGIIFLETVRRHWRGALYWGLGVGLMGTYIVGIMSNVEILQQYAALAESMPPAIFQMLGLSDAAALGTPEGFIAFGFFTYTTILLSVYGVAAGLNITANDEDEGILDSFLSLPIHRWQVIIEKFVAYKLFVVIILLEAFTGLVIGSRLSQLELNMGRIMESCINLMFPVLFVIALTACISVLVKRKSMAVSLVSSVVVSSYFINFLGQMAGDSLAANLSALSYFHYVDAEGVMKNGLNLGNSAVLLVAMVVCIAVSVGAFQKRDVGA
jgi:ABC-type transport system involved in multi-copper enzyme maturation permease subunit